MIVMMLFIWCFGSKKLTESLFTGEYVVETHRIFIVSRMFWDDIMTLAARYKKFIFLKDYKLIGSDE